MIDPIIGLLTPHFRLAEFASRDGVPVPVSLHQNLLRLCEQLEVLRKRLNEPLIVMSGYRTVDQNTKAGGARLSQHLTAKAADIRAVSLKPEDLAAEILGLIKGGHMHDGGIGIYPSGRTRLRGWVHYDIRHKPARWRG